MLSHHVPHPTETLLCFQVQFPQGSKKEELSPDYLLTIASCVVGCFGHMASVTPNISCTGITGDCCRKTEAW